MSGGGRQGTGEYRGTKCGASRSGGGGRAGEKQKREGPGVEGKASKGTAPGEQSAEHRSGHERGQEEWEGRYVVWYRYNTSRMAARAHAAGHTAHRPLSECRPWR